MSFDDEIDDVQEEVDRSQIDDLPPRLSDEELNKLLVRYRDDFLFFAPRVLKVQTMDFRIIPFTLNKPQRILHAIIQHIEKTGRLVRIVGLKARRMGFSTYFSGRFYHKVSWNPNRNCMQLTHEPDATSTLFNMVKRFYNFTPEWLRPQTLYNNTKQIEFNTKDGKGLNSMFRVATAVKKDVGSGQLVHYCHMSEVSKWPIEDVSEDLLTSLLQCVPDLPGTEVVFESTAKGIGGEFYDRFWNARYRVWIEKLNEDGEPVIEERVNENADVENLYTSIFLPWYVFDIYRKKCPPDFKLTEEEIKIKQQHGVNDEQLYWRRDVIANKCKGSLEMFQQEYPACIAGGTRVGTSLGLLRMKDLAMAVGKMGDHGRIEHFWRKGVKPIFRLITSLGYELLATADHQIALRDGGFSRLDKTVGLDITLQPPTFALETVHEPLASFPLVRSSVAINEDFARFVGFFMGDGSFGSGNTLSVVCDKQDGDVIEDVVGLFRQFFGEPSLRTVGSKKGGVEVRLSRTGLLDIFVQLGMVEVNESYAPRRKVCVPEFIFRSPRAVVRQFLRGLFEADGFADYQAARVVLFVKHPKFLKDIQLLLLGFGITCRYHTAMRRNGNGFEYQAHELSLRAAEVKSFMDEVGFVSTRKTSRQKKYLGSLTGKHTKRNGRSLVDVELHDRVVMVEPCGESEVYDITISDPDKPWFGANGILAHNCPMEAFVGTGRPVFDNAKLLKLTTVVPNPIARYRCLTGVQQWINHPEGELRVWEEPKRGRPYIIGADVSEGLSHGDFSSADVIDHITGEQVAQWHGLVDPDEYGVVLMALGKRYNNAWLGIERNNHGLTTVTWVVNGNYPNVYAEMVPEPPGKPRKRYGWLTSGATRPLIIDQLVREVREDSHGLKCLQTIEEMMAFKRQDNGKMEADVGRHDDRVLSIAIAKHLRQVLDVPGWGVLAGDALRNMKLPKKKHRKKAPSSKAWT